jgi:hypothetical protein
MAQLKGKRCCPVFLGSVETSGLAHSRKHSCLSTSRAQFQTNWRIASMKRSRATKNLICQSIQICQSKNYQPADVKESLYVEGLMCTGNFKCLCTFSQDPELGPVVT